MRPRPLGAAALLLYVGLFFSFACAAGPQAPYEDNNSYFSIMPPVGWRATDLSAGYRSSVKFSSPDDNASILLVAELDDYDLGMLYSSKKEYVEDQKKRFPEGDFLLSRVTLAGFPALKIDYRLLDALRGEVYYFYFDGLRFDLAYSGRSNRDFDYYHTEALAALTSIKPKKRPLTESKK